MKYILSAILAVVAIFAVSCGGSEDCPTLFTYVGEQSITLAGDSTVAAPDSFYIRMLAATPEFAFRRDTTLRPDTLITPDTIMIRQDTIIRIDTTLLSASIKLKISNSAMPYEAEKVLLLKGMLITSEEKADSKYKGLKIIFNDYDFRKKTASLLVSKGKFYQDCTSW